MINMINLGELVTAMVTPFDEGFSLDLKRAFNLGKHLIKNGTDCILISGTTGESPTISDEEKLDLFKFMKKEFGNEVKIMAGTGSNDTRHSIELSKKAEQIGVDALLVVGPYYNKPTQTGLYRHFEAIAEAVRTPIIIYNVPSRTSCNIDASTTIELSKIANIVGVKEASGNLGQVAEISKQTPGGFAIYSGNDSDTLPILILGGQGVISVASHIIGLKIKEMIKLFKDSNLSGAKDIHLNLMELFKAIFIVTNPIPIKKALNLMGIEVGKPRLPLLDMEGKELEEFKHILIRYNIIK
ncbi:MAG: 4-hydroxy-tetrahydrodipicolinate synthase [Candidatus Humimicrobiaceae bacterium]